MFIVMATSCAVIRRTPALAHLASNRRLQQAEQLTPELTHAHHGARLVTRDLLQLSGLRPGPSCAT